MADDPFQKALDQIAFHEAEALRIKRWVNEGDAMLGNEPRFNIDCTAPVSGASMGRPSGRRWQEGMFFNKPLAGAVRTILEACFEAARGPSPASVDEIHEALSQGSYDFGTTNTDTQKQSIRISLGKNSVTFVRLPNSDKFGLVDWYGPRSRTRARRPNGEQQDLAASPAPEGDQEEAAADTAAEILT